MFLILWKELIFLNMCRYTCMWSFIFQYYKVISKTLSCTYVIRGHFQVPVPCKRSERIGSCVCLFFSLERQFHANEKHSKRVRHSEESKIYWKELCSDVLSSVMATVLCNLWVAWGTPACAEQGAANLRLQSAAPVTTLTSSWSRGAQRHESRTVLAHIWYLSCTAR